MDNVISRDGVIAALRHAARANGGVLTEDLAADAVMPQLSALAHEHEELRTAHDRQLELDRVIRERHLDDRRTWRNTTQTQLTELRRAILSIAGIDPDTANDNTDYVALLHNLARRHVEIVSYRDPDANTDLHLFVNGTEITGYVWTEADPGAGHDIQDWRESRDAAMRDASPAAAELIERFYDTGEGSEFITGKEEGEL